MKRLFALLLAALMIFSMCACDADLSSAEPASYDTDGTAVFSDNTIQISGTGLTVNEVGELEITDAGVYQLSGTASDNRVLVKAGEDAEVILILAGLDLTNTQDDAIYIKSASLATIVAAAGTENTITSGILQEETDSDDTSSDESEEEDDASGAAIHAKCDLTVAGGGSLTVNGYINNGIAATSNLTIESGDITVYAANDTLKSKQTAVITGGTLDLHAEHDAVQAETDIIVTGGTLDILTGTGAADADMKTSDSLMMGDMGGGPGGGHGSSGEASGETDISSYIDDVVNMAASSELNDASDLETLLTDYITSALGDTDEADMILQSLSAVDMDALYEMIISGETIDTNALIQLIASGEMSASGEASPSDEMSSSGEMDASHEMGSSGEMGGFGSMWDKDSDDTGSQKGLKATDSICITGGTLNFDTEDDAIHSDGTVDITGGTMTISAGDDGIHAGTNLTIDDGSVEILLCYEGLEGTQIIINGGYTNVDATDDGLNASGGSMMFGGPGGGSGGGMPGGGMFNFSASREASSEASGEASSEASGETTDTASAEPAAAASSEPTSPAGSTYTSASDEQNTASEEPDNSSSASGEASDEEDETPLVRVTGGTLIVKSGGDGLDSNGSMYIEGGYVYVTGPASDWDAAIDKGDGGSYEFIISGGVTVAGGYSGMAESPEESDDSQCSIYYAFDEDSEPGDTFTLTDANGTVLAEYTFVNSVNCIIVSTPELAIGQTYTLTLGDQTAEVTMESAVYSNRSHGGFGGDSGGFGSHEASSKTASSEASAEASDK